MNKKQNIKKQIEKLKEEIDKINPKFVNKISNKKKELTKLRKEYKSLKESEIKHVELEILVEEIRKTVCILGEIIQIQNASLKDDNVKDYVKNRIKELKNMKSLEYVKKYLGEID